MLGLTDTKPEIQELHVSHKENQFVSRWQNHGLAVTAGSIYMVLVERYVFGKAASKVIEVCRGQRFQGNVCSAFKSANH